MCSIFPFQNDLLSCSFSIQGLFNRIPVLILQIQGLYKEKVIFKEFFLRLSSFPGVLQAPANHVITIIIIPERKIYILWTSYQYLEI